MMYLQKTFFDYRPTNISSFLNHMIHTNSKILKDRKSSVHYVSLIQFIKNNNRCIKIKNIL